VTAVGADRPTVVLSSCSTNVVAMAIGRCQQLPQSFWEGPFTLDGSLSGVYVGVKGGGG
jgi:hypothetical protein